MTLNKDSKLVKFSYLLERKKWQGADLGYSKIPAQTSLCAFFWRTFVFMPLFFCAALLAVVGGAYHLVIHWQITLVILAAIALSLGIIYLMSQAGKRRVVQRIFSPVGDLIDATVDRVTYSSGWKAFWAGFKTIKGKVCPVIEFK